MVGKQCVALVGASALLWSCSFDSTGVWNSDSGEPLADAPVASDAPVIGPDADLTIDANLTVDGNLTPDADQTPDADTKPDAQTSGLIDEGLVVRYFLDEAASGQGPTLAHDAAPAPLDLTITYTDELSYTEVAGNRGLSWSATGVDARASVAVDSTKIHTALHGSKTGTIEVVIDVQAVTSSVSRISHIGWDQQSGRFTLASSNSSVLRFHFNEDLVATWDVSMPSAGRIVVHLVFDSTEPEEGDRARLYVDGSLVDTNGDVPALAPDATIDLGTGRHYVLGNREVGGRSFRGEMFYAAMYSTALSAADVAQNAEILSAGDDSP